MPASLGLSLCLGFLREPPHVSGTGGAEFLSISMLSETGWLFKCGTSTLAEHREIFFLAVELEKRATQTKMGLAPGQFDILLLLLYLYTSHSRFFLFRLAAV